MPAPQSLEELAYASYLQEHDEPLTYDGNYTEGHLAGVELEGFEAGPPQVIQAAPTPRPPPHRRPEPPPVAHRAASLRGAIVDGHQLMELAPALAAAVGIDVRP